jgi:CIC family chloride channel protein
MALRGEFVIVAMLLLMVLKIVATSLTLGSGGSGGVFAPGLFVGAMLGGTAGQLMHALFPDAVGPVGAYALVGMGAVFAASTHASITAVIIVFEMTGDYQIILPLMFSVVIASIISRYMLGKESIYTMKLVRRGIRLEHGRDVDILRLVRASEVMTRDTVTVRPTGTLEELTELFLRTNRHAFAVVDENARLCGIVSLSDVRNADHIPGDGKVIGDIMTQTVITAFPDETLDTVLVRMGPADLSRLPVVAREDPLQVLGVIRRNDVVRAYNLAVARQAGER